MTVWFLFSSDALILFLHYINRSPHNGLYSGTEFAPTFLTEFWNAYQQTCENMLRTNKAYHSTTQISSIWNLIPLLMKEILVKKEKVWCQTRRHINKQKRCLILSTKGFEDKCLGTIRKMKSVLPSFYIPRFECIQIFCILQ